MKKSFIRIIIMALIAALLYASSYIFEGFIIDHIHPAYRGFNRVCEQILNRSLPSFRQREVAIIPFSERFFFCCRPHILQYHAQECKI